MTDYQKKKMIDLGLALFAVVLVGLFLRTQLKNPIMIDVGAPEIITTGGYVNTWNYDGSDQEADAIKINQVSMTLDDAFLDVLITHDQMAQTEPVKWQIWFDSNTDDGVEGDVYIDVDEALKVNISRMENGEAVLFGEGEATFDEGVLLVRMPNSRRLDIKEGTPYRIGVVYNQNGQEMTQYLP